MAITPNVATETQNKQNLRGVTRGGANAYFEAIDFAILVNSAATASGVLELVVPATGATTFSISGTAGNSTTLTGTATGSKVNDLVSALAAGPLANTTFYVNAGGANYLNGTTTTIIVASGVVLTVISGTGVVPTLTALTLSGTNAEAVTYPNYVGTPNAVPTWVDDATVHAYQVGIGGAQNTQFIEQKQVRQIQTNVSETQQYNGYLATYSGNLFQTAQKRTYRQQS
jgi:hypothetical protein